MLYTGSEIVYIPMIDSYIVDEDLFAAVLKGCIIDLTSTIVAEEKEQKQREDMIKKRRDYLEQMRQERESQYVFRIDDDSYAGYAEGQQEANKK